LLQVVRPLRFVEVRHPHGQVAVGGRTTLHVVARGHGTLGSGDARIDVDGAFDGLWRVAVVDGVAVVEARGLPWRQRRHVAVVVVPLPAPPPPVRPALPLVVPPTAPAVELHAFDVSIEVP
jgi:hypothetical protein